MKVLIFGASGSGTTTLGKEIEKNTEFVHLDADNYYWKKTDPPYVEKIPLVERNEKLKIDFDKNKYVIISGSLISWGKEWQSLFDLVIFIYLDCDIRMKRLRNREFERYGDEIRTNKEKNKRFNVFMEWASQYDNPTFKGRSFNAHSDWIKQLNCAVLRMDGALSLNKKVYNAIDAIRKYG